MGPSFMLQDGKGLNRQLFSTVLDSLLIELNIDKHLTLTAFG